MKLILIRGPICAGKSTTVELLRQRIADSSYIDFDAYKRAIDANQASEWRDRMAFESALYLAKQLMKKKRVIIADIHSSKRHQYNKYRKLAKRFGYEFYSFLIYPPLIVCLRRNEQRKIPSVNYVISDQEVMDYWEKTFMIKGEKFFDSSKKAPERIVDTIARSCLA